MKNRLFYAMTMAMVLFVAGINKAAAQTQVATLQHNGEISVFYGATALSEAHEAAQDGDVITLSSGAFTMDTITKAITIHGAGLMTDTISGTAPTIINSDIAANVVSGTQPITIEGILFAKAFSVKNLSNPRLIKCYFNSFTTGDYTQLMAQSQFVNCRFRSVSIGQAVNSSFVNCVLWGIDYAGIGMEAYNSYIRLNVDGENMSAFNCIFDCIRTYNPSYLGTNSTAFNCIGILGSTSNSSPLFRAFTQDCWTYLSNGDVFQNYNTEYLTQLLILKEEIASTCIGTDGTQVGIHGGPYPYNDHPYYMVVKHCTVGDRTTDDGQLSVDIEVVTEE